MEKQKKSKKTLKIVLCCVLGFIVAVGGAIAIWWLCSQFRESPVVEEPDDTQNYKSAVEEGARFSEAGDIDGVEVLGRLAYVLDQQEFYHSESTTRSSAFIATQTTNSFKDYRDGIMLASDFTYGFKSAGTQSCFVLEGDGAGVYMRTSSGSVSGSTNGTNADWNDDIKYYDKGTYNVTYGQYSTEMTVYILNSETVLSWDDVVDNGDGTYTQTYYLDAEKAAYFYQYAMQTRGGLDRLPEFESLTLTVTFDDYYRVLTVEAEETSTITYIFSMGSSASAVTQYSYDESSFDEAHYSYYESYYEEYVGTLDPGTDGGDDELDALSVLAGAFAGVLNGEGQQFDGVVTLGSNTYYGRLYLNIDMSTISSDVLGSIDVRVTLSADENIDDQDLYLELSDGALNCYYSSDFAFTVNVNDISSIISDFEEWAQSVGLITDSGAQAEADEDGGSSFSLEELLNQLIEGLTAEESEDGVVITLSLDDVMGIGLSATFNFDATESSDGVTYSFTSAELGSISYDGSMIAASLTLTPSSAEVISHDASETPFDLSEAAEGLLALLNSEIFAVDLSVDGGSLAYVLEQFGVEELGSLLGDLSLDISGRVNISDLTADISLTVLNVAAGTTVISGDIYYDYSEGEYGTAYLAVDTLLNTSCDLKLSCGIAEVVETIQSLLGSEANLAAVLSDTSAEVTEEEQSTVVTIISGILGLDFGEIIKNIAADSNGLTATVNIDYILGAILGDEYTYSLGDVTLAYTMERDSQGNVISSAIGGTALGGGLTLGVSASDTAVTAPYKPSYVDIFDLLNSVADLFDSPVDVELSLEGSALASLIGGDLSDFLGALTLEASGAVDIQNGLAQLDLTVYYNGEAEFAGTAYYIYGSAYGEYGRIYLNITNLLGNKSEIKVYCDVDEIFNALGSLVGGIAEYADGEEQSVIDTVAAVLSLDLSSMIRSLRANSSGLSATVDLDELLGMLIGDDYSYDLGFATLSYTIARNELSGMLFGGGLSLAITDHTGTMGLPADRDEYLDFSFVADLVGDVVDFIGSGASADASGNASYMYTLYQEELSLNLNASMGLTLKTSVVIKDLYVTVGIDENGEFVLSLKGELQNSWLDGYTESQTGYYTASERTIGLTYYNGYLTFMNQAEGEDAEYRVMTADYLLDNLLTYDSATFSFDNVLSWYLGMGDNLETLLALFGAFLPSVSSDLLTPDDIYMYDIIGDGSEDEAITLLSYLLGYMIDTDGTTYTLNSENMESALANLGLTESSDYYALSLNASAISSMFEALDIAIMRDNQTGIGGLKAYLSIGGMIYTLIDLDYSTEYAAVTNYYKYAVETFGIDFEYDFSGADLEDGREAIFGEYNSAAEDKYVYSEKLTEHTLSVYNGNELVGTQSVKYGSTIYLYDTENLIVEDGVAYIYVIYDENGDVVTGEDGSPVTTATVSGDLTVYKVLAADFGIEIPEAPADDAETEIAA